MSFMTTTFVKYSRPLKYHFNRMLPVLTVDFLSKSLTVSNQVTIENKVNRTTEAQLFLNSSNHYKWLPYHNKSNNLK